MTNQHLQQSQITNLIDSGNQNSRLKKVCVFEFENAYFLQYYFFSIDGCESSIATLYTQKNEVRLFKTLNSAFKHVKHLTYVFNDDGKVVGLNDVEIVVVPDYVLGNA